MSTIPQEMNATRPAAFRFYRHGRLIVLILCAAAALGAGIWWFGPWSAPFRYRHMDLVSLRQLVDREPNNFLAWKQLSANFWLGSTCLSR